MFQPQNQTENPYNSSLFGIGGGDDFSTSAPLQNSNDSVDEIDFDYLLKIQRNRRFGDTIFYILITAYSVLIILGSAGNSLVVFAVARKPSMRTARNVFIINLAVADLFLCIVTVPLTLMELLTQFWPLGNVPFVCKTVGTLQATCIFVSTLSITAIALDRYQVIVYPTRPALQKFGAVFTLLGIWIISSIMALPNFVWRDLSHHEILLMNDLLSIDYCYEKWPVELGRVYYTIFVMVVQYCVPILTLSIAYIRICIKLRKRMETTGLRTAKRGEQQGRRVRKTNTLLISIALIFLLSWLPFHVFHLITDLNNPFGDDDEETMYVVFAVCHMMGMSSACSNPLLYGWLNENFRKEFLEIFALMKHCGGSKFKLESKRPLRDQSVKFSKKADITDREGKKNIETTTTNGQDPAILSTNASNPENKLKVDNSFV